MRFKRYLPWIVVSGILLVFFGILLAWDSKNPLSPTREEIPLKSLDLKVGGTEQDDNYFSVKRVIDGDTIELLGGERVRYIGIDTPEPEYCLGNEARTRNKQALEGKKVRLEKDIEKLDKYSRTLAYVFADGVFINEVLVKEGLATVTTYPPNVKYVDRFVSAQSTAKEQKLGVWSDNPCPSPLTSQPLPPSTEPGVQGAETGCLIKGNISSSGEKIYHVPGQRYYEKTKIEEEKGERWFCSEEEAVEAGWRKSKV